MPTWSDELATHHPEMDRTHREFIDHMTQVEAALTLELPELLARYDAMLAHTVEHFAREDEWMLGSGYAADNCHSLQHRQVLGALRDVRAIVEATPERRHIVGELLVELLRWFEHHARMADAGLAEHLAEQPQCPTPAGTLHGCGSDSCGDHAPTHAPAATATA